MSCRTAFATLSLAVILSSLAGNAFAEQFAVDDEGFVRNWLILAPIPLDGSGADDIEKEQINDEAKLQPKEGEKATVAGKTLTWAAVKTADYFFDICEIIKSPGEAGVGYAVAYVVAPEEMTDVEVAMGSNDQGRLYVNGKQVALASEARPLEKDQDSAKGVTLKKGVNVVILKTASENNNWQGCVRFKKNDKPIKTLKVQTSPS
jgi:hypothetical protein